MVTLESWNDGASKAADPLPRAVVVELRANVRAKARRTGAFEEVGDDHLFRTIDEAVAALGPAA